MDAVLVTQIGDGDVFEEMEPQDGDLLLGGESLASLLGHGTTSARDCSLFERAVLPIPSEAEQFLARRLWILRIILACMGAKRGIGIR